jgi:glycosyltransferase involved in cell wall biosynthesis
MNNSQKLKFSIITIVYNGRDSIEKTILSVIGQKYENVEYIIIDGESNDGTTEIIRKYNDKISYWLSEKDHGIYYAMNKGLSLATGDWICMMNSGDSFYNDSILSDINNMDLFGKDIIIGSAIGKSPWGDVEILAPAGEKIWKGFCHQAIFENKNLKNILYDTNYKYASDFNRMYYFYIIDAKFKVVNSPFAIVDWGANGFTAKNYLNSLIENIRSVAKYPSFSIYKYLIPLIYRIIILSKAFVGRVIYIISPNFHYSLKKIIK